VKPKLQALRKELNERQFFAEVFGRIGEELGIPVYSGLPVGHGKGTGTLELGAEMLLTATGEFRSV
jgi:muramoyltetrapeptide carboxypeptidase LdcA involved in peptidoglycan recycling